MLKPMLNYCLMTVLLSLVFMSSLQAANMQFLRYSPVSQFTAADFEMMNTTAHNALETNTDGKTSEWENPDTKNSGSITPISTETIDGNKCRKVKIVNQANNQYAESIFTFCKIDNDWKVK